MIDILISSIYFLGLYVLPLVVFTSAGIRLILGFYSARSKILWALVLPVPHSIMLLGGGSDWLAFSVGLSLLGAAALVLASRGTRVWFYWIELIVAVVIIAAMLKAFGAVAG